MCGECPKISPDNEVFVKSTQEQFNKEFESDFEELEQRLEYIETHYRDIGRVYHAGRLSLASVNNFEAISTPEALVRLNSAYHNSSIDEYDELFTNLHRVIVKVIDSKTRHIRSAPHVAVLVHRNKITIPLVLQDLEKDVEIIEKSFSPLFQDMAILSERFFGSYHINWAHSNAHEEAEDRGDAHPPDILRSSSEWGIFRAWVASLPETVKSTEAGRMLDNTAWSMLLANFGQEGKGILVGEKFTNKKIENGDSGLDDDISDAESVDMERSLQIG